MTLDPDVAAKLTAVALERRISFKQALNDTVRAGLEHRRAGRVFTQYTQPMGLRPGFNLDKALQLAGALRDEEIVRRLKRRK